MPDTLPIITVIPYHVLTGPVSQFELCFQAGPFVLLYKSTRANESCVFAGCAQSLADMFIQIPTSKKKAAFVFIIESWNYNKIITT